MCGLRYSWVVGVLSVIGMLATPGWAEVITTGDTKDDSSTFYAGYNAGKTGTLTVDAGSVFNRSIGYLGYSSGSTGTGTITGIGSKWTNSDWLHVGWYGSGTLRVEAGGQVSDVHGYLGYYSGSAGVATISGAESKWANSGGLYVGNDGSGVLRVEAGGQVSNGNGYLGFYSGSTGTAVITGAGSKWTNSTGLYVGRYGSGTLTISDGGMVSAKALYSSLGDLYGDGSIAVQSGVVLDADLSFDATHGLTQSLAFGSGGTLQFTVDPTGPLGAGYRHAGSLRIAEGRAVTSGYGYLGYNTGSAGAAVVTGVGSKWTNTNSLYIGDNGSGMLRVEAGAQVSNSVGYLGNVSGSMGEAVVTGAGAKWTNSFALYVGSKGSGKLTVSEGGVVSAKTLYASLSDLYGNGTITVQSGGVLDTDLSLDATHGLTQTLAFGSGGTLQFTVDGTSELGVGYKRSGSLRVTDGRSVTSTKGYLGYNSGSAGEATITGAGSKWTNSSGLYAGYNGSGILRVEAGGQVSGPSGYLGYNAGSAGEATITGAGSKWTNSGVLNVGYNGSGTLRVEAGAQVNNTIGYLGYNSGSTGEATITGAGSKWTNSGVLNVGYNGSGTLRVEDGAQVSNTSGYLGYNSGSTGEATITGAGSKWNNSGDLYVGESGSGTLTVEAGGQVSTSRGCLGYNSGSTGTAVITGAGSNWTNSGELRVGLSGSGTLTVSDGGVVSAKTLWASLSDLYGNGTITVQSGVVLDTDLSFDATHGLTQTLAFGSGGTLQFTIDGSNILGVGHKRSGSLRIAEGRSVTSSIGYLGYYSGSAGAAIVTGAGSKWTNSGDLYVGSYGNGTLTVSDGGVVSTKTLYASLSDLYGNGTITTSGVVLDADLIFDAAHDLTQSLSFGPGGTLQFTIDGTSTLGVGYMRSGSLRIAEGRSITSWAGTLGYNSSSTGTAVISGAESKWTNSNSLRVGFFGRGTLRVESGAEVSNYLGYVGTWPGSVGTAIVTGAGSRWTNSGELHVGYYGGGTVAVSDGAQVAATNLSINSQSTLRLHVSGDRMLVVGDASTIGRIYNMGKLSLLADAFLPAGTYRPIGQYADRTFDWSGSGSTLAVGGVWDSSAKTFTVSAPTLVDAGTAAEVASGMRLLISDMGSGGRAGVSFGTLSSGTTLTSLPLTESERAALLPLLGSQEMMLSGWDFAGELAGGEALVSFEVGMGAEEVRVWKRSQGGWGEYAPEMLTYDSKGIVSFTVDPGSLNGGGYAVTGLVPEPMGLGMLMVAAGILLGRRRVRCGRMVRTAAGARFGRS